MLLGSGLIGLAGFRRKNKKILYVVSEKFPLFSKLAHIKDSQLLLIKPERL